MSRQILQILFFTLFALGLPLWAMQTNEWNNASVHACTGDCYEAWRQETGGVVQVAANKAAAKAAASPVELGKSLYTGCVACHGAGGEGGIGPSLSDSLAQEVQTALEQYRAGQTRGNQSSLMWSQAKELTDDDIANLSAYIDSL